MKLKLMLIINMLVIVFISNFSYALRLVINDKTECYEIYNENNKTMAPIRFISESLGAKVEWKADIKLIKITKNNIRIILQENQNWAIVNILGKSDTKYILENNVVIKDGKAYVPVRFLSEVLEGEVIWDGSSGTVFVNESKV